MNWARRILGETTTTGDIAPVMVGVAPQLMATRRDEVNRIKPKIKPKKRKTAVESILGESEEPNLIPDTAVPLLTSVEQTAIDKNNGAPEALGKEDLLEPALALVAPDTTPNATRELDPSLVPSKDPALDTLLGDNDAKPLPVAKESIKVGTTPSRGQSIVEGASLPSGEMPRPPGEFLRPIEELDPNSTKPKIELVVGSSNSSIIESSQPAEGQLGASFMPPPKSANLDQTMSAFRRYHRVNV